jgi:hypothetical protein
LSKEERRKAQKARYAKARAKGTAGKGGFPGEPGAEPDDRMAHRPHHEEDPRNDDPVYRAEMKEKHRVAREKHKRERKIRDRHGELIFIFVHICEHPQNDVITCTFPCTGSSKRMPARPS